MRTVMVLGATGMLGSMAYSVLSKNKDLRVLGTSRKSMGDLLSFDVHSGLPDLGKKLKGVDYVVNCIGITKPYCHDDRMNELENAIQVNSLFPFTLNRVAEEQKIRVIQIATDCVYSGKKGSYKENDPHDALDTYGKTKSLGEVRSKNFLNIRCSIIGPERINKTFLLEWFLKQPKGAKISGFSHHLWNGVTTLQFAELCENIITNEKFDEMSSKSSIYHFVPNNTVNKYELLCIFNDIFERGLIIEKIDKPAEKVDRTLQSQYDTIRSFSLPSRMDAEIKRLKAYISENGFYNA